MAETPGLAMRMMNYLEECSLNTEFSHTHLRADCQKPDEAESKKPSLCQAMASHVSRPMLYQFLVRLVRCLVDVLSSLVISD